MSAKGIIVALSVVAVLGALVAIAALSFTAAPTAAQEPTPPAPTATPLPPAEPPIIPPEDTETLAQLESLCYEGFVYQLHAEVVSARDGQGKTVSLQWRSDLQYWEFPEEITPYYRIQRQTHDKDAPTGEEWETVDTQPNIDVWEGPVETGHWHYRVRLVGLTSGDSQHECEAAPWAEDIFNVLTPQEELAQHCEGAHIYDLTATVKPSFYGQGDTVTLEWDLVLRYALPPDAVRKLRVERMRDGDESDRESNWETVATVNDTDTWTGPAEPGNWLYRVALVSLQAGDLAAQCEELNWSYEVEVWVPTAEERTREASDRKILIEQATTCATDVLTSNLTPAARTVVGRHIDERVVELAKEFERAEDLVVLTVLFCSEGELVSSFGISISAQLYILSLLFEDFYW